MKSITASETSPQTYARLGGLLYLIIIVAGIFGELFVRGKLVVMGDAAATANNIMAAESLWRIGITGDLVMHICDVFLMVIFYVLLKPVNKNLALLVVFFNLVTTAVLVAFKIKLLDALFLLGSPEYLKAFEPEQLQALAYVAIKADAYGFGIGLLYFGFECLVLGYLIFRSGYFPKTIGILMQIAGFCYLTNSFALLLAPKLAAMITPAILIPCFIGELSFCLWLLIKGVNLIKWHEKASAK